MGQGLTVVRSQPEDGSAQARGARSRVQRRVIAESSASSGALRQKDTNPERQGVHAEDRLECQEEGALAPGPNGSLGHGCEKSV